MENVNTKLTKAYQTTFNCYISAVANRDNLSASRFREELHSIIDLQLNEFAKQIKEEMKK